MAAKYLITGVAGSGKSTVAHELSKRGYAAYDTDAGFSYYVEKATGKRCDHPQTPSLEWYAEHERVFDEEILEGLFKKHAGEPIFICSITANQKKYYPQFDKIFLLSAKDDLLAHRLQTRTNSDFGKHPVDFHRVFAGKKDFEDEVIAAGGIKIDSSRSLGTVIDEIASHINEH